MEVLNEIIPCGIDPVGVFILQTKEERERGEKDLREIHRLLGALPVGTVHKITNHAINEVYTHSDTLNDILRQVVNSTTSLEKCIQLG